MEKEPCIICKREALFIFIRADYYEYRCENCGKYFFSNGLNKLDYENKEKLDEKGREKISKFIREYNKATEERAKLGDLETLWKEIEDFNRTRQRER